MLSMSKLLDLGSTLSSNSVLEQTTPHIAFVYSLPLAIFPQHHLFQTSVFPAEAFCVAAAAAQRAGFRGCRPICFVIVNQGAWEFITIWLWVWSISFLHVPAEGQRQSKSNRVKYPLTHRYTHIPQNPTSSQLMASWYSFIWHSWTRQNNNDEVHESSDPLPASPLTFCITHWPTREVCHYGTVGQLRARSVYVKIEI